MDFVALPIPTEASTASVTRLCLEAFQKCIQQLNDKEKIHIQTRLADLRLWADSVGAAAQAKASLDWRFKHRPDDIKFIRGLLCMLEGLLKELLIVVNNGSDVCDAITNIDSTVDSLAFIGIQIRRSGRKSRLRKADDSFEGNQHKYHKFRAHLACIITSKPTEEGRPKDEGKEIHSLDEFANLKLPPIQQRLVEANLRRRHRFMEAQRHSHGLQGRSTKISHTVIPQQFVAMAVEKNKTDVSPMQNSKVAVALRETPAHPIGPRKDAPTLPGTSASGLDSKWGGLQNNRRTKSTVTRITAITAAARYPKAQTSSNQDQMLVKCPCCCQAIPASELEDSQWRKHVANDLCPYTCILEDCPTPYNLFITQKEWNEHVMNDHPPQWQCPCCEGEPPVFKSLSGITTHIMSEHPDIISDDLEDLLEASEINIMGITKCPLCDSEGPQDSPELVEHVLQHIHSFSLCSLPWPMDPDISLDKPVGKFDMSHAVKISRDEEGIEHIFRIDEWAETVAPILDRERGVKFVNDDEGNELIFSIPGQHKSTTPESEQLRQLCDIDRNPPKIGKDESEMIGHSAKDYFSQNDYFMDESGDDQLPSQTSQSSQQTKDRGRFDRKDWSKRWICTLCRLQSTEGDDVYFSHLEDVHRESTEEAENNPEIELEQWKRSMLNDAYWNGFETISATSSLSGLSHHGRGDIGGENRSGTSISSETSSINNPKLLSSVEDAIKRLILPELDALKEEQRRGKKPESMENMGGADLSRSDLSSNNPEGSDLEGSNLGGADAGGGDGGGGDGATGGADTSRGDMGGGDGAGGDGAGGDGSASGADASGGDMGGCDGGGGDGSAGGTDAGGGDISGGDMGGMHGMGGMGGMDPSMMGGMSGMNGMGGMPGMGGMGPMGGMDPSMMGGMGGGMNYTSGIGGMGGMDPTMIGGMGGMGGMDPSMMDGMGGMSGGMNSTSGMGGMGGMNSTSGMGGMGGMDPTMMGGMGGMGGGMNSTSGMSGMSGMGGMGGMGGGMGGMNSTSGMGGMGDMGATSGDASGDAGGAIGGSNLGGGDSGDGGDEVKPLKADLSSQKLSSTKGKRPTVQEDINDLLETGVEPGVPSVETITEKKRGTIAPDQVKGGIFSGMTVDGPVIGTLVVIIDRAKDLPNRRSMGKQDPYCAARLGKEAKKTTTDRRGGQTPKWDQELRFTVHDSADYHQLKVSVFNDSKKTELIGETWVSLEAILLPGGKQSDGWHSLSCRGKYAGDVRLELTYYDSRPKAEKPVEPSGTLSTVLTAPPPKGVLDETVANTVQPQEAHPEKEPAIFANDNLDKWKMDIQIKHDHGNLKHAVALLDTGQLLGNLVSSQFIEHVGKTSQIRIAADDPLIRAATATEHSADLGQISLEWTYAQSESFYRTDFYVYPPDVMNGADVILGAKSIVERKLLKLNEPPPRQVPAPIAQDQGQEDEWSTMSSKKKKKRKKAKAQSLDINDDQDSSAQPEVNSTEPPPEPEPVPITQAQGQEDERSTMSSKKKKKGKKAKAQSLDINDDQEDDRSTISSKEKRNAMKAEAQSLDINDEARASSQPTTMETLQGHEIATLTQDQVEDDETDIRENKKLEKGKSRESEIQDNINKKRRSFSIDDRESTLEIQNEETIDDFDENNINVARKAVQTTAINDPNFRVSLDILSKEVQARYERLGAMEDLEELISIARKAIEITPGDDPCRGTYFSRLGNTLQTKYKHTGAIDDLEEAITMARKAIEVIREDHPSLAFDFSSLGNKLQTRHERTGAMDDLEEAISMARKAIENTPEDDPNLAFFFSSLGNTLQTRYERTGVVDDLEEAISIARKAIEITPKDNPSLATYFSRLGNKLQIRYDRTGAIDDLEEAISIARKAIEDIPEDHPKLTSLLDNLGIKYLQKYQDTGDTEGLNEATQLATKAVDIGTRFLGARHSDTLRSMANLASVLRTKKRWGEAEQLEIEIRDIIRISNQTAVG